MSGVQIQDIQFFLGSGEIYRGLMLGGFWRSPGSHNCKIREQSEASTVVNSGVLGFWVSAHADASQTFSWSGARPIDFLQVDRCERHRTFAVILRAILDLLYWVVCS